MSETDGTRPRGASASQIEVAFARFEGSVTTELKNVAHDVKNLITALAAYATIKDLKVAEERIDKLEKNQSWLVRTIIGAVVASVLAAAGYVAKGGH